ncbi:MAG: arginyltransferase [Campylobacter sp.]|nr:arginyltransferase [Campylobacter sp.]
MLSKFNPLSSGICFSSLPSNCPYLDGKKSRTEFMFMKNCSFELNSKLVQRGQRRFGGFFEKPVCADCKECVSLRIDAQNFRFTKSKRRVINKNSSTSHAISRPQLSLEHINLFNKYHDFMHEKNGWRYFNIDLQKYYEIYASYSHDFGKEIAYYIDGRLVCVDLVDMVDDGISSVYCYYDPDYSHLSLGKYSLLNEIIIAKKLNLRYIYLGYYVKDCPSLVYKAEYEPFELLKEYVELDERPIWE